MLSFGKRRRSHIPIHNVYGLILFQVRARCAVLSTDCHRRIVWRRRSGIAYLVVYSNIGPVLHRLHRSGYSLYRFSAFDKVR